MWWIFQVLQTVGYYGFGSLAPVVLAAKGHSTTASLGYAALSFCGYPLGSALSIPLIERFERRTLIIVAALGQAFFGLLFGFADAAWLIVGSGFLLTVCSNVFSNAFHVYQAEIFPTNLRSSAIGIAYSLSRLVSVILPFIALSVLDDLGATAVFAGSAVLMVLLCLNVGLLARRRRDWRWTPSERSRAGTSGDPSQGAWTRARACKFSYHHPSRSVALIGPSAEGARRPSWGKRIAYRGVGGLACRGQGGGLLPSIKEGAMCRDPRCPDSRPLSAQHDR
ncbi:MFS transporter [Streptomyces sp. NPDC127172]|uniref:MFS transporter n=1 Tax=Streptomyces sp. NPDC127172 TaxID=3345382 RepID=UPI003631375E